MKSVMILYCILNCFIQRSQPFRPLSATTGLCRQRFAHAFSHSTASFQSTFTSLQSTLSSSILYGLNDAQVEAVTQPLSGITRVVAGPGAGKTRVLTCRIAHLLHEDPNNNVLAVTFTKKASSEMRHRLETILKNAAASTPPNKRIQDEPSSDNHPMQGIAQEELEGSLATPLNRVTLGTIHSVCAKILKWNNRKLASLPTVVEDMVGSVIGTYLDGSFSIADQTEQIRIVKNCLEELRIDPTKLPGDIKILAILTTLGKIKARKVAYDIANDVPIKEEVPESTLSKIATQVYPLYREKMLSSNTLDFDDLIFLARELLHVHVDVREALQKRWHHVLVDEFQDTSDVQVDLVRLLTSESLLVVGDADQSIYGWRGAAVENMSDFEKNFQQHHIAGVKTVYLMENYRSTTNIVHAAQKVISANNLNSQSPEKNNMRRNMKPMRGTGATPRVIACDNAKAEASFVIDTIQKMIASEEYTPDHTIAIIYRTNFQSRALEEACVAMNLPYVIRGSAGAFYSRHEVKDCLCFLRWIHNGRDQAAMVRAFKTPSKGIGDKAVVEFDEYVASVEAFYKTEHPELPKPAPLDVLLSLTDGSSIGEHSGLLVDIPSASDSISKRSLNNFIMFSNQMRVIKSNGYSQSVSTLLSTIIDVMDLKDHFNKISKSTEEFGDRWNNVQELRQAAELFTGKGSALEYFSEVPSEGVVKFDETPLGNFLSDVALVAEVADDMQKDGIDKRLKAELMTIHASKGMEFDAVFLVGNEDGTLPSQRSIGDGSLDEERRLCYVAMTRAKNLLVMSWRKEVSFFQGLNFVTTKKSRSRFLDVLIDNPSRKVDGTEILRSSHNPSSARQSPSSLHSIRNLGAFPNSKPMVPPVVRAQLPTSPRSSTGVKSKQSLSTKPTLPHRQSFSTSSNPTQPTIPRKGVPLGVSKNLQSRSSRESGRNLDSTWFYPVGSSVHHKQYGRGEVLHPPPKHDGEMMVRVKFVSGKEMNIPAMGSDLFPC